MGEFKPDVGIGNKNDEVDKDTNKTKEEKEKKEAQLLQLKKLVKNFVKEYNDGSSSSTKNEKILSINDDMLAASFYNHYQVGPVIQDSSSIFTFTINGKPQRIYYEITYMATHRHTSFPEKRVDEMSLADEPGNIKLNMGDGTIKILSIENRT